MEKIKTGFKVATPIQWINFMTKYERHLEFFSLFKAISHEELNHNYYTEMQFLITCINKAVNTIQYVSDKSNRDYWNIFKNLADKGDCEDFVLTKRLLMTQAGIPIGALNPIMCLVKDVHGKNTGHMVLAIQTGIKTLICDNIIKDIRSIDMFPYKFLSILQGSDWYQILED